jgi:hypothetical protein
MTARPRLRIISWETPPIPPARSRHTPGRRAPVRIVAIDGRFPNHRVFSFELDDRQLDELIATAERLEARQA